MNPKNKRNKAIAILLITLILFQNCVVYHQPQTTLEQASKERVNTKVVNTNGEISKYK